MRLYKYHATVCALALSMGTPVLAAHSCKEDQTVKVVSSCAWVWPQSSTEIDPWSKGTGKVPTSKSLLAPEDCVKLEVVDVETTRHGYVGVECTAADGESARYWINPQFLSCGDGVSLRSMANALKCDGVSTNPTVAALASRLGENEPVSSSHPVVLPENAQPLLEAADKTMDVLAVTAALQATAGSAQDPVNAQIAQKLPEAYALVQEARANDTRILMGHYGIVNEDTSAAHLARSWQRIQDQRAALEAEVGATCDQDLLLSRTVRVNELQKACRQHQDAAKILEEWRAQKSLNSTQFLNQILASASGRAPTATDRARKLILMSGIEQTPELLKNGSFRNAVAVSLGDDSAIPYVHDGYMLGGSRAVQTNGTDCSEFVFQTLQKSCSSQKKPDAEKAPTTRQFRLFSLMLRGAIPWDADQVGGLSHYRGCFDSPEITADTPPGAMDIAISNAPGSKSIGHMAWVLKYDSQTRSVTTFEAAGGSAASVIIEKRPVFEATCHRTENSAPVPRADLILLRIKAQPDPSCPLAQ